MNVYQKIRSLSGPRTNHGLTQRLEKPLEYATGFETALKTKNESDWINYRKHRNKVNNMKKHALCNYYDSIDLQLSDASSSNNNKL